MSEFNREFKSFDLNKFKDEKELKEVHKQKLEDAIRNSLL